MWHIVGYSLFVALQVGGAAVGGPVVGWSLNVVVGIPVGEMTEETFDVVGFDGQQLLPSEDGGDVVLVAEPVNEFHKSTNFGMIFELEWHDPACSVIVNVRYFGLKKKYQKEKNR